MFKQCKGMIFVAVMLCMTACHDASVDEDSYQHQPQHAKASSFNVQLGLAYLEHNNLERAKLKLLLALEQDPNSPVAHNAMAYFYEKTSNLDDAEYQYKKALQLQPAMGATLNNYGAFLCRQGRYALADTYFVKAVHDPHYVSAAEAYENAGLCALKAKDLVKAQAYFAKSVAQDSTRLTSRYELAELEYDAGHYDAAAKQILIYADAAVLDKAARRLIASIIDRLEDKEDSAYTVERLKKSLIQSQQKETRGHKE